MNDIQRRIGKYIEDIEAGRTNWNDIILAILRTDLKFWETEQPTLHRNIYFMVNQLLDMLNLERNGKYWQIPYEFADLLSMAVGYMVQYGDPASFMSHRVALNSSVKGEAAIVAKYEERWQSIGKETIEGLLKLLDLHTKYDYFKVEQSKFSPELDDRPKNPAGRSEFNKQSEPLASGSDKHKFEPAATAPCFGSIELRFDHPWCNSGGSCGSCRQPKCTSYADVHLDEPGE